MFNLNISCTFEIILLEKKRKHHQTNERGNSGNSQKLSNYFRLQDWDSLGYAYVLIIKKVYLEKSRVALKCTFWTMKRDVFQLDLNGKRAFFLVISFPFSFE